MMLAKQFKRAINYQTKSDNYHDWREMVLDKQKIVAKEKIDKFYH